MISPDIPNNENLRLDALNSYRILDSLPEIEYDEITALASMICNTPMSLISLIDEDRQWFKSHHGLNSSETPKEFAFCAHAINDKNSTFVVNDARKDERFHDNPLVTGDPNLVFYAGIPLVTPEGQPLGTLCVLDVEPNQLTPQQEKALEALSNQVMKLLELRKTTIVLHQNNQELLAKNKTLENFVSIAAHDIKTPMNNALSISEMLMEDHVDTMDPEALELLGYLHTSVLQSNHLIDGILNYSINPSNILERKELVHIKTFLLDIEELLVTKDNIHVTLDVDDSLEVFINKTALHQIFSNLISNSIKYNHRDHIEIIIQVTESETGLNVSVKDNGPGIDEKDHKNIFKLFSTTLNKDTNGFHGTGIGLATVENLVHGLGGEINVVSTKGEGATFVFNLQTKIEAAKV